MTKSEVEIGGEYKAKVSGIVTTIRIVGVSPYGGWDAVGCHTGCKVRVKTAARLRVKVGPYPGGTISTLPLFNSANRKYVKESNLIRAAGGQA